MKLTQALRKAGERARSLNTDPISREAYAGYFSCWGGSFIVHLAVLQFLEDAYGIKTEYRGYFRQGQRVGAIGTWGPYLAGDWNALRASGLDGRFDLGFPILHLPIAPGHRCTMLHRAAFLLVGQRRQVGGTIFRNGKSMAILRRIPDDLPTGKRRFRNEERWFGDAGGTPQDIGELGADEIVTIYDELHTMRWQRRPLAIDEPKGTLDRSKRFLFGKVFWLKTRPVAIQINCRAEMASTVCTDSVNGAADRSLKNVTAGSLLLYVNGRDAWAQASTSGKRLLYSYGGYRPGYKQYWCHPRADRAAATPSGGRLVTLVRAALHCPKGMLAAHAGSERKREVEGRAVIELTFGPHATAVTLHNPVDDGEPNAGPFKLVGGMQALEYTK